MLKLGNRCWKLLAVEGVWEATQVIAILSLNRRYWNWSSPCGMTKQLMAGYCGNLFAGAN